MGMTDIDRKLKQLRSLIATAHYENYDFVFMPVGDAKTIVRLLEELKKNREVMKDGEAVLFRDRTASQRGGSNEAWAGLNSRPDV